MKTMAAIARMLALRKAGIQSWRSREGDGDAASFWNCSKAWRTVMRAERMLLMAFGMDMVWGPLESASPMMVWYSSQTEMSAVQQVSSAFDWDFCQ